MIFTFLIPTLYSTRYLLWMADKSPDYPLAFTTTLMCIVYLTVSKQSSVQMLWFGKIILPNIWQVRLSVCHRIISPNIFFLTRLTFHYPYTEPVFKLSFETEIEDGEKLLKGY